MSPLNITQPLGIWSMPWLLFQVMSNIPKMGQLPTPVIGPEKKGIHITSDERSEMARNGTSDALREVLWGTSARVLGRSARSSWWSAWEILEKIQK